MRRFLFFIFCAGCIAFNGVAQGYVVADRGAWCWFADPRALHHEDAGKKIDMTYIGYIDTLGNIKATQHDFLTGRTNEVVIRSGFQPDDHNNPTFLVLPDGRVMIFYTRHTTEPRFYYRISRKPGDITDLGEEKTIVVSNNTTYPSPFILSNDPDHIYLCWRGINWHPTIGRLKMPDRDDNTSFDWGPKQIIQSTGSRPYAKYYSNGKDRIWLTYTTGHPDNEYPNWVYFNCIEIPREKGSMVTLRDVKGNALARIDEGPHRVNRKDYAGIDPAVVVDSAADSRDWIWEVTEDKDHKPVIAMVRIKKDKRSHDYYYVKWTGKEWRKTFLTNAGGHFHQTPTTELCYSGGMAIDDANPNTVYCSVPVTGTSGKVYELVKYKLDASGHFTTDTITRNSPKNNVRPYIVENSKDSPLRLVWMRGDYFFWLAGSKDHPGGYPTSIYSDYQVHEKSKRDVMNMIRKVNDYWQRTHPLHGNAFWNTAAYHTGNMAAYQITGEERYRRYSEAWAEKNEWKGAKSDDRTRWKFSYGETDEYVLFGDWQACFQTYVDLYRLAPDKRKIARAQEVMEYQMSTPGDNYLWWADGLYMVMPGMMKLYTTTENPLYLQKLYAYFSYAKGLMYDADTGLFFRDQKYVYPKHKTVSGKKDFWARGNGWVFAALAKVLQDLPADDIHRPEYTQVFQAMAKTLKQAQQPNGSWTRSIFDALHAPGNETSGTAFFVYGYLWGINNGILSQGAYKEVAEKGWQYLSETALQPDGLVGYVQPIGERADQHKSINERSTADFGVGAFLLAAAEMTRYLSTNSTSYFLDAINGDDSNPGTSPQNAWRSLQRLKQISLRAGDKVLLKCGGIFTGRLEISATGTPGKRVIVDAYGEGKKPRIVAPDSSLFAILIRNSDYLSLQNLDVVNTGSAPMPHRTGVKVLNENHGVSHNIVLSRLDIHDVNGSLVKNEGGGSGILIENKWKDTASPYDSLVIEHCTIRRCHRNAIIWKAPSSRDHWQPSTHTIVRYNVIEEVPGDGIVPIGCDGTLIEYNVMRNCPDILPEKEAAAGIWPWSSDNTIIQFNEVSDHKAPWDAQGFDSDWNCKGTIIQYNYSHDNYGGMVLICDAGKVTSPWNIGNVGSIVRYNISINDGIRPKPTHTGKMFSPSIHIAGPVKNALIERNIIHVNKKFSAAIDRTMVQSDSWDGYAQATTFRENFFYAAEESRFNMTKSVDNTFDGNYYLGTFSALPEVAIYPKAVLSLYQTKLGVGQSGFEGLSHLITTVPVCDSKGVFVDKKAVETFFEQATFKE